MTTESDPPKHPARDPKTGRFVNGNCGNLNGGRKKTEYSRAALMDSVITDDDWAKMINVMRQKALDGDVPAFKMLFEFRFGKAQEAVNVSGELNISMLKDMLSDDTD